MTTIAPCEKINVAFPENVTSFLNRRAERDRLSIPQTLNAINVIGTIEDEAVEDETNDPFYSESNMRAMRESIAQIERGEVITMTFEELEVITNEAMKKLK